MGPSNSTPHVPPVETCIKCPQRLVLFLLLPNWKEKKIHQQENEKINCSLFTQWNKYSNKNQLQLHATMCVNLVIISLSEGSQIWACGACWLPFKMKFKVGETLLMVRNQGGGPPWVRGIDWKENKRRFGSQQARIWIYVLLHRHISWKRCMSRYNSDMHFSVWILQKLFFNYMGWGGVAAGVEEAGTLIMIKDKNYNTVANLTIWIIYDTLVLPRCTSHLNLFYKTWYHLNPYLY